MVLDDFYFDVLDHGFVRLDGCMASDLSVVNSARVSFAKRSEELDESGVGLIGFLMREKHGTPFEHNAFRFHVRCPLFVAREWQRHRIGSFNEVSARYSKLKSEFYMPENQDVRTQVGKPGAYRFDGVDEEIADYVRDVLADAYDDAWNAYEDILAEGVAKELARLVLPVGIYTEMYWTVNARSLMNFLSLRNADTAMFEIRQFAIAVEKIVAAKMPVTMAAFEANGRVAP